MPVSIYATTPRFHGARACCPQQVDCEHDSPAYRGRSAARWVPVGDGLTHKLTDLRSWLLNCRSSPAGESYGSQLTGWAVTQ